TLAGSASDAGYSLGTIPQALIGPGSVIVVTLGYWYQPLIGSGFVSRRYITKQAFYAPSFVPSIPVTDGSSMLVCPGY
ncbi:MAG: hypothetical protein JWL62_2075, partial [Hyphomicrobiales bacterium]|nr:hypothetical protein [Hyphomicrobiales bacterium]